MTRSRCCYSIFIAALLIILNVQLLNVVNGADDEMSDLNYALQLVIGEMNDENFFIETWSLYYPMLPVPVVNNCYNGKKVELTEADEQLKSIIERKSIKVGITPLAAQYPAVYSKPDNFTTAESKSFTSADDFVEAAKLISLDLKVETLDGYELVIIKEAIKRLGTLYNVEIIPEIILISTESKSFFGSLRDALNNDEIDVAWSALIMLEERKQYIDYVCNTYATEIVVAASADRGSERPDPTGPNVSVACNGAYCTFPLPPPFTPVPMNGTMFELMNVIVNTTDQYNYTVNPFERLRMFFAEHCPNCTEVEMNALGKMYQSPATKKKNTTGTTTNPGSMTQSSSSATSVLPHILVTLSTFIAIVGNYM